MITAAEISERLTRQAESVAQRLLPNGKRDGREWVAGSAAGEAGKSLKVCLGGDKAGLWCDFATSQSGDLLDLWAISKGISIADALRDARDYLGISVPAFVGTRQREYRRPERPQATKPKARVLEYLHSRGLTDETIAAYKVAASPNDDEIVFPFLRGGELINVKYLKLDRPDGKKQVRQEKEAEPCLFGWQAISDRARSVVLAEGEIDAMTWQQMGFPALSVWSGAGNVQWIENEWDRLSRFDRIYVAFDADEAGQAGAKAVVERLGRARCRVVSTIHKDANECLQRGFDRACFRDMIDAAKSMDPKELRSAASYRDAVLARFFPAPDSHAGWLTPFPKLNDRGVVFQPAELILVNGINGHGKTRFVGQLVLSLNEQGAKACIASMELKPDKLLQIMAKQACGRPEPSRPFIEHVLDAWNGKLWLFDVTGTAKAEYLLDVFRYARACYGITIFVIDSLLKCGIAEDDYNGQKKFVESLCDFKNETDSTVFLVTHSRKLESETRPVDKMDIRGSGSIADLVDTITTLWRNKSKEQKKEEERDHEDPDARWYWQKNRNGDFEGVARLWYDRPTGQFVDRSNASPRAYVQFVQLTNQDDIAI